ncbi:MAG: histidinol dehydrogenase [Deltaproteobacteria bacterium]|nr:histidinol dehydrogenase [Deltaproteobacteria bacterium]
MNLIDITSGSDFFKADNDKPIIDRELQTLISKIINEVSEKGDSAVKDYSLLFDRTKLTQIKVKPSLIEAAYKKIPQKSRVIFEEAIENIRAFHGNQIQKSWSVDFKDKTRLGEKVTPLDRVGIYVPGGTAFYPSTLMMNCIPAQLAGVPSIMIASPPGDNGLPNEMVLAVSHLLGIDEVYSMGGAQAIAAMAYGTETIRSVCKITGPGNKYVTEAKRQVFGKVGIDSVAGPSEILILDDDPQTPIEYLVRDMISQAEHDPNARSVLITPDLKKAEAVKARLESLVPTLPRNEIIVKSLSGNGKILFVKSIEEGIEIANQIAPEHLEVILRDRTKLDLIRNAGAIFIGPWSPEPVGDYFAGPNHTIPTSGAAKYASPLSVRDFQKHSSIIEYSKTRLLEEGENIALFAELEELPAHAASVRARLNQD